MVTEHRSKHRSQTSASTIDHTHNTTPECNLLKKNDIKDGFSPLKTKLELWFIGRLCPYALLVILWPARGRCTERGGARNERREG